MIIAVVRSVWDEYMSDEVQDNWCRKYPSSGKIDHINGLKIQSVCRNLIWAVTEIGLDYIKHWVYGLRRLSNLLMLTGSTLLLPTVRIWKLPWRLVCFVGCFSGRWGFAAVLKRCSVGCLVVTRNVLLSFIPLSWGSKKCRGRLSPESQHVQGHQEHCRRHLPQQLKVFHLRHYTLFCIIRVTELIQLRFLQICVLPPRTSSSLPTP